VEDEREPFCYVLPGARCTDLTDQTAFDFGGSSGLTLRICMPYETLSNTAVTPSFMTLTGKVCGEMKCWF